MAKKVIKVGSKVMWRGSWGMDPARPAKVESIEKTKRPHEKDGVSVDSIPFSERECSVMSLDNDHWCYGTQIVDVLD